MIIFSYMVVAFFIISFLLYIWLYSWNLFNIWVDDDEGWLE